MFFKYKHPKKEILGSCVSALVSTVVREETECNLVRTVAALVSLSVSHLYVCLSENWSLA